MSLSLIFSFFTVFALYLHTHTHTNTLIDRVFANPENHKCSFRRVRILPSDFNYKVIMRKSSSETNYLADLK